MYFTPGCVQVNFGWKIVEVRRNAAVLAMVLSIAFALRQASPHVHHASEKGAAEFPSSHGNQAAGDNFLGVFTGSTEFTVNDVYDPLDNG